VKQSVHPGRHTAARIIALAIAAAVAGTASAESSFQTGAGALTAKANLDFQITVPKILFLQVGTGTALANNATINLISFTVPAANVGDGVAVAASAGSGDLGNGAVTAKVIANNGTVTFSSTTAGAINDGAAGDTVSWGQIGVAVATLTSGTALAHPALADGATTTTSITATNKVVNQDAKWTYTYKNQNVIAAGTYGGVNTNNGRVTYTASIL
jgi:hypothetical protein